MDAAARWASHPEEWQPTFLDWQWEHPEFVRAHVWPQYGGQQVVGLAIGQLDRAAPLRLVAAVPHAHEPAQTSACVDLAWQLVTGHHADGEPTDLPRNELLADSLVVLLPDTNSQGRARASRRCWDGDLTNEEFLKIAFGIAADGQERFGRYPEWRFSEHRPAQVGIEYEQVSADLWVEPNTSRRAIHCRALDELHRLYDLEWYLDLHQHEHPEAVLLPEAYERADATEQAAITRWGEAVQAAWTAVGITEQAPMRVPYAGGERQRQFAAFWAGRCPGLRRMTIECRNNGHYQTREPTSMERQFLAAATALRAGLLHAWREAAGR